MYIRTFFIYIIAFLCCLAQGAHYQVLQNDAQGWAVKINPAAYDVQTVKNVVPDSKSILAFNANYFWQGQVIGRLFNNSIEYTDINIDSYLRPIVYQDWKGRFHYKMQPDLYEMFYAKFVFQAGPTLITKGQINIRDKEERFRYDSIRPTNHISFGVTPHNKVIVFLSHELTLTQIAQKMKSFDCNYAIKLDGGNSSYLTFSPTKYSYKKHYKVVAGVIFKEKMYK